MNDSQSSLLYEITSLPAHLWESYIIIKQSFSGLRLTRWQVLRLFVAQAARGTSARLGLFFALASGIALAWILSAVIYRPPDLAKLGIPVAGKSKGSKLEFGPMLDDATAKHPNQPFLIRAFGHDYVIYPSKHWDEIKRLPESRASLLKFLRDMFHSSWSGIARNTHECKNTILTDLTRAIPSLIRSRQHDCAMICDSVLGDNGDWVDVKLYYAMQDIIVQTNSSAFVGRALGMNKTWTSAVASLPLRVAIPTLILSATPFFLRPLIKPLLFAPVIWSRYRLGQMLAPILWDEVSDYCSGPPSASEKVSNAQIKAQVQGKVPMTAWLLRRYAESKRDVMTDVLANMRNKKLLRLLVDDYLNTIFESTATSSGTLFYVLIELALRPDLQDVLRNEIRQVAPGGELPPVHLNELRKMDSVLRESSRINAFSYLGLMRRLESPTKLSTGPALPAGTTICVDIHHINTSPELWGPGDPNEFDGLRHYRARQQPGREQHFKFANLGSDSPGFGDGAQACPGRMFADNTIKVILTHVLTNYEVRLRPGEGKPKKGSMPEGSMYPDIGAKVQFRRRK